MKIGEIYRFAVEKGMEKDPRGKKKILDELKKNKEKYEKMDKKEKERFDTEKLKNPYADTRILCGDPNKEVKSILLGVDMEVGEVLAAQMLIDKGEKIDLIISHHPEGSAYASLDKVMYMQADILNKYGVPINVAEDLLWERIKEVEQGIMPANHQRAVDMAKLFDIPMMCIHTPADNHVVSYLQGIMDKKNPSTLGDVVDILKEIPEYNEGDKQNNGPKIVSGSKERSAGKVFVDMTGGTEGSEKIFEKLANTGIGTVIEMHLSLKHTKEAQKNHVNAVIAGHIPSDNLGLNLLIDEIIKKEKLKIIPLSGFRRFAR
jgi:putative NIF3 family GTP cyclohydrolase 1 type 2